MLDELEGVTVTAMALGWDGSESDGTDWSLLRADLPRIVNQFGTLTITYVDALEYTQYVVNGIPVDPRTIRPVDYANDEVLVASGWEGVPRNPDGKWTSGPGGPKEAPGVKNAETMYGTGSPQHLKALEKAEKIAEWQKGLDSVAAADAAPKLTAGQKAAATKKANAATEQILNDIANGDLTGVQAFDKLIDVHGDPDKVYGILKAAAKDVPAVGVDDPELVTVHETPPLIDVLTEAKTQMDLDAAKTLAASHKATADTALNNYVLGVAGNATTNQLPTEYTIQHASAAHIDSYLAQQMSKKSYDKLAGATDDVKREAAQTVLAQHQEDLTFLNENIGYSDGKPALAVEARRAVLRESGLRKPTGGPMAEGTRNFYGESAIRGMSRDKQEAIIQHHQGAAGGYTKEYLANQSDAAIADSAVGWDKKYKAVHDELAAKPGTDMARVPHSYAGAVAFKLGAPGLPKAHHIAAVSHAVTHSKLPVGKPANWETMSPGKKAAWTKKNNKSATPISVPHPAEWSSMSPGKKAAWTKKYNAGITTTSPLSGTTAVGEHQVHKFTSGHQAVQANQVAVDSLKGVQFSQAAHEDRIKTFVKKASIDQNQARNSYIGSGYGKMNRCKKYGEGCTDQVKESIDLLTESIKQHGTPAQKILFRGKSNGPLADLSYQVGQEFTEPGFGSWSGTRKSAKDFASTESGTGRNVFYRLVDSKGIRTIPGTDGEKETITPPGVKYRIVGIQDFTDGTTTFQRRILDVEVVSSPYG